MKKQNILYKFNSYIDELYTTLDNVSDLLELDVDDEVVTDLTKTLRDNIQCILDKDVDDIIDAIDNLTSIESQDE